MRRFGLLLSTGAVEGEVWPLSPRPSGLSRTTGPTSGTTLHALSWVADEQGARSATAGQPGGHQPGILARSGASRASKSALPGSFREFGSPTSAVRCRGFQLGSGGFAFSTT